MRQKLTWFVLLFAAISVAAFYRVETVRATPNTSGFKAMTIASGTFAEFRVFNHASEGQLPAGNDDEFWVSLQRTEGRSDLYVQSNVWQPPSATSPGGSTGWHTHPGHSLIIVTAGTITEYDALCIPHVYNAGDTFVDPGHGHVHLVRNEGTVVATGVAVQLVPYDPNKMNRRIDAPAPETCSYIQ